MKDDLLEFYQNKFINFEKILEEYGLKPEDINSAKGKESWIHSGVFNDCNNLYPCLRNLSFRDPHPGIYFFNYIFCLIKQYQLHLTYKSRVQKQYRANCMMSKRI